MTLDWSRLNHAYGPASDLPRLFAEAGDCGPDLAEVAWEDLWASLYHQGTVYPASFAALPVLADIATGRVPGGRRQALALAGRVVTEEQQLHPPGYVQSRYPSAVAELHRLTRDQVTTRPFDGDEDDFLYWLENLLAFEGVPVWRRNLRRDAQPVVCPSCAGSLEIDLSQQPEGTRRRHADALFRGLGREGPVLTGVRAAAPADLPPMASRLRSLAVAAGRPAAAVRLARLFGRTTCPVCAADFSVPDRIAAFAAERSAGGPRRASRGAPGG
ncbi:hypothetical protein AB0P32_17280 [Streptomyces sp. NPDC085995]|uniref:hypothetical protein n=1 Tax=Streptomyces sp. NPDC085995 TaxID=3154861 RepID=UPI003432AD3B